MIKDNPIGKVINSLINENTEYKKLEKAFIELYDSSELLFKWYADESRRGRDLKLKIEYSPLNQQRLRHAIIKYGSLRESLTS
jgi:hypothetical protein